MNELVDKKAIIFLVGTYSFLFSCLGWLQIEFLFISPIKALGSRQKYRQLFGSTRTSVSSLPLFRTSVFFFRELWREIAVEAQKFERFNIWK